MWFDHVPIAVESLDKAAADYRVRYGLGCAGGGEHPQGTRSRIIPLDATCYIELLEASDPTLPWGWDVVNALAADTPIMGLAFEVDDIAAVSERLAIPVSGGEVTLEDGTIGTWGSVSAGDELPFFIRYRRSHAERSRANARRVAEARHTCSPAGIAWVEIAGDETALGEWIGPTDLDIRVVTGRPGVVRFAVKTTTGEFVFKA